jgi:small subunit ribosomal protein S17
MADEPDTDTPETRDDAPAAADAVAPEEPQPEAHPQAEAADEPQAEAEPPAEDAAKAGAGEQAPAEGAGEPADELSAKERRRLERSRHTGSARSPRSPEERHSERQEVRRAKALRRRVRRQSERANAAERRASAPPPAPLAPVHAPVEGKRRVRQGVVVSDKAEKTITVRIDVARRHRRYEKIVRSSSTVHAHDESNDAHEGDIVRVIESRPLSRSKRWTLVDVLERAR